MKSRSHLLFFSLFVLCSPTLAENSERVTRMNSGTPIEDLVLNPSPEIQKDEKAGTTVYLLKGIYYRESWDLEFQGKRVITDGTGVFSLRVPAQGKSTTFELIAKGPGKKKQSEKIGIIIPVEEEERSIKEFKEKEERTQKTDAILETASPLAIESSRRLNLTSFYFAPLVAVQNGTTQKNYTLSVGWTPQYQFSTKFGVRFTFGAMTFDKANGGKFFATETAALGEWKFLDKFSVAVGPGFQYWWAFGGLSVEAVGDLSYNLGMPVFKTIQIDRVFSELSWLFDNLQTKQVRVGMALSF